jgi:Na+/H+ antiporter NhaC
MTCLACIHYRFFPILFIGIIFITILCEKDFGPMVQFEKDAAESPILHPDNSSRSPPLPPSLLYMASSPSSHHQPYTSSISTTTTKELGPLEPDTKKPMRWQNAVLPFGSIVVLTFIGMILDGYQRLRQAHPMETFGLMDALSNCNSVSALIRASAAGWFLAVLMLYSQNIITLEESTKAWLEGVKEILDPTLILILAWALGKVITEVKVAPYIASIIGNEVQKEFLPAITTILCYFATGSGFGTMAIMFPIISPLSWSISHGDRNNLLQCFGSILGGAVFGNTCSPIADTSILTSLSAHIPLENHIKSIMPYALFVAIVSIVFGALPIGFNIFSTFTAFAVSFAVLLFFVFFCGTKVHSRFRALSSASFLSTSPPSKYSLSERYPLIHTAGENE